MFPPIYPDISTNYCYHLVGVVVDEDALPGSINRYIQS